MSILDIKVKLYATLRKFGPEGLAIGESFTIQGKPGWTIADLVNSLGIPPESAKLTLVDGTHQNHDFVFPESGASIAIFPPVGGG